MLNTKEISNRIKQIMMENSPNQERFANLLNVTQPAVSNYLQGRIPPPHVLLKISELGGKSIEWILTGENQVKHIAESGSGYGSDSELIKKINSLPQDIRTSLMNLIQSLISSTTLK